MAFAHLLIFAITASPIWPIERLVVGPGGFPWDEATGESSFLSVAADSVWIWGARTGQNLGPVLLGRGGKIGYSQHLGFRQLEFGQEIELRIFDTKPELAFMLDGDETTAFDPEKAHIPKDAEIYIDLGGTFWLNSLRFYPRLDKEHRGQFLQFFRLQYHRGHVDVANFEDIAQLPFNTFISYEGQPYDRSIATWPITGEEADLRQARYIRLVPLTKRAWEIAELEIYTDGRTPPGNFLSTALPGSRFGSPIWGQWSINGMDPSRSPVLVWTRTGPDDQPLHYFVKTGVAEDLARVEKSVWENMDESDPEKGPARPNPAWSPWEAATRGVVHSPPNKFLQFRMRLTEPGTKVERLAFEYTNFPLAQVLEAEINPEQAPAGRETSFVLSLLVKSFDQRADRPLQSGFRLLELLTRADIVSVDSVQVNDENVVYTVMPLEREGKAIKFWRRVTAGLSFVQIFFRGRVFSDATRFQVRVIDTRPGGESTERVSQFVQDGDIVPESDATTLTVRLASIKDPLLHNLSAKTAVVTPNDDGINDIFAISYDVLRLTRPAPASFEIFDLSGRLIRQGASESNNSGRFIRVWDGIDDQGQTAPTGIYLYNLELQTDSGPIARQGLINLVY